MKTLEWLKEIGVDVFYNETPKDRRTGNDDQMKYQSHKKELVKQEQRKKSDSAISKTASDREALGDPEQSIISNIPASKAKKSAQQSVEEVEFGNNSCDDRPLAESICKEPVLGGQSASEAVYYNIHNDSSALGGIMQQSHPKIELYKRSNEKVEVTKLKVVSESRVSSKSRQIADKASNIAELYDVIKKFDGCDLKKAAKNTVLGDGTISDILLIGEAPGAQEDLYGIPFCGQSGKLLDNILKSIGLSRRENCYITNTVFWRPPGNRRPTAEEIAICRPFVEKHIALINPKLIILVGSTAVESLLNLKQPMKSLKSQYFDYTNCYIKQSIRTAIILHPSYLLRQPSEKKAMWFDVMRIKNELIAKI